MVEFDKIERAQFRRPILLHAEDPNEKFPAYVDVDEKYNINDKISMVNTLVQMQNVTSYPFMHNCLRDGRTHIHALWFDVYTGEVHCFSRKEKVKEIKGIWQNYDKSIKKTYSEPIKRISIETKKWYIGRQTIKQLRKYLGKEIKKKIIKKLWKSIWQET